MSDYEYCEHCGFLGYWLDLVSEKRFVHMANVSYYCPSTRSKP